MTRIFLATVLLTVAPLAFAQNVPPSESVEEEPVSEEAVPPAAEVTPQTGNFTPPADVKTNMPMVDENAPPAPPEKKPTDTGVVGKEAPVTLTPVAPPPAEASSPAPDDMVYGIALLQGINKATARAQTIEAPTGEIVRFGNLEIIARSCWQAPPEERPENAALLEVWELKPGEGRTQIYNGWMFSSSPSLVSLSHPVYDLTVLECQPRKTEAAQ